MPKQIFNPLTGKFDQVLDNATELAYVPTTSGDWPVVPNHVGEALDSLAASSGGGGGTTITTWQPLTPYAAEDIIYDTATYKLFICPLPYTSTTNFDSDLQAGYWIELSSGGVKSWTSGRLYVFDEIMLWSGSFYICTFTHTSSGMSPNLFYWSVIGGGAGEVNTASNIGTSGEGLFAQKSGVDLQFKNIVAGSGISLSSDLTTVTINNTDGASIGDTKLTYTPPASNWLALNGQNIFKPEYPALYAQLPNELTTATQTLSPPVGGNNGWYGNQGNLFISNGKMLSFRRFGGASPNSTTNQVYISDWNATTRALSNTTAVAVSNVSGTTFSGMRASPSAYIFPYLCYSVDSASGQVVSKWTTAGAYDSAVAISGTGGTWNTLRMALLNGFYYIFGNISNSATSRLVVKDAVLDTWSVVGTYSVAFPSGYYFYMSPAVFKCTTDNTIYMAAVVGNSGGNYQLCLFKDSGSFVFTLHQTLGTVSTNFYQYAADIIEFEDTSFIAKIGTTIYRYDFNSGTGNFDQFATSATLASLGFSSNTQYYVRTAKHMAGFAGHISYDESHVFISNSSETRTFSFDRSAFTFTALTPVLTTTSVFNSNGQGISPDGYTHIVGEQGTNSAGTLNVRPVRKTLATLADPATSLKYYVKAADI